MAHRVNFNVHRYGKTVHWNFSSSLPGARKSLRAHYIMQHWVKRIFGIKEIKFFKTFFSLGGEFPIVKIIGYQRLFFKLKKYKMFRYRNILKSRPKLTHYNAILPTSTMGKFVVSRRAFNLYKKRKYKWNKIKKLRRKFKFERASYSRFRRLPPILSSRGNSSSQLSNLYRLELGANLFSKTVGEGGSLAISAMTQNGYIEHLMEQKKLFLPSSSGAFNDAEIMFVGNSPRLPGQLAARPQIDFALFIQCLNFINILGGGATSIDLTKNVFNNLKLHFDSASFIQICLMVGTGNLSSGLYGFFLRCAWDSKFWNFFNNSSDVYPEVENIVKHYTMPALDSAFRLKNNIKVFSLLTIYIKQFVGLKYRSKRSYKKSLFSALYFLIKFVASILKFLKYANNKSIMAAGVFGHNSDKKFVFYFAFYCAKLYVIIKTKFLLRKIINNFSINKKKGFMYTSFIKYFSDFLLKKKVDFYYITGLLYSPIFKNKSFFFDAPGAVPGLRAVSLISSGAALYSFPGSTRSGSDRNKLVYLVKQFSNLKTSQNRELLNLFPLLNLFSNKLFVAVCEKGGRQFDKTYSVNSKLVNSDFLADSVVQLQNTWVLRQDANYAVRSKEKIFTRPFVYTRPHPFSDDIFDVLHMPRVGAREAAREEARRRKFGFSSSPIHNDFETQEEAAKKIYTNYMHIKDRLRRIFNDFELWSAPGARGYHHAAEDSKTKYRTFIGINWDTINIMFNDIRVNGRLWVATSMIRFTYRFIISLQKALDESNLFNKSGDLVGEFEEAARPNARFDKFYEFFCFIISCMGHNESLFTKENIGQPVSFPEKYFIPPVEGIYDEGGHLFTTMFPYNFSFSNDIDYMYFPFETHYGELRYSKHQFLMLDNSVTGLYVEPVFNDQINIINNYVFRTHSPAYGLAYSYWFSNLPARLLLPFAVPVEQTFIICDLADGDEIKDKIYGECEGPLYDLLKDKLCIIGRSVQRFEPDGITPAAGPIPRWTFLHHTEDSEHDNFFVYYFSSGRQEFFPILAASKPSLFQSTDLFDLPSAERQDLFLNLFRNHAISGGWLVDKGLFFPLENLKSMLYTLNNYLVPVKIFLFNWSIVSEYFSKNTFFFNHKNLDRAPVNSIYEYSAYGFAGLKKFNYVKINFFLILSVYHISNFRNIVREHKAGYFLGFDPKKAELLIKNLSASTNYCYSGISHFIDYRKPGALVGNDFVPEEFYFRTMLMSLTAAFYKNFGVYYTIYYYPLVRVFESDPILQNLASSAVYYLRTYVTKQTRSLIWLNEFILFYYASIYLKSTERLVKFLTSKFRREYRWGRPWAYMTRVMSSVSLVQFGIIGIRFGFHGKFSGKDRAFRLYKVLGANPCLRNSNLTGSYSARQCKSIYGTTHFHIWLTYF